MNANEILKRTRELLSDEKRWTKENFARDHKGEPTIAQDSDAAAWCLIGAKIKVSAVPGLEPNAGRSATKALRSVITQKYGDISTFWFNDDPKRTHAEVLEVLDLAIKETEVTV